MQKILYTIPLTDSWVPDLSALSTVVKPKNQVPGIYTDNTIQSTESVALHLVYFLLFCQLNACYLFFPFLCTCIYHTISCQPDVCCMSLHTYVLHWCQMFCMYFRLVFASHWCHVALYPLHGFWLSIPGHCFSQLVFPPFSIEFP